MGKALIANNGYSGEYAPALSNKLHPCSVLVKISNAAYKPFKLALREYKNNIITAQYLFDVERLYLHKSCLF
ncbi:hypothetical protein EMK97_14685 [Litorilituus sediminis]|uniref:Uncharacterized protein n=1 Tax=Litorilituus sediminis TaxID=718192 RepID=A0A4P6P859_9GAMM|nr:hypothetical protein EMK97_14685 [Litorilituus sediminis]